MGFTGTCMAPAVHPWARVCGGHSRAEGSLPECSRVEPSSEAVRQHGACGLSALGLSEDPGSDLGH